MREILFRGKSKHTGEWVTGAYVSKNWYPNKGVVEESNIISYEDGDECLWHLITPETVGQYTGLTDKNGKKIFEGDIVKHDFGAEQIGVQYAVVEYDAKYASFMINPLYDWMYCVKNDVEIIGNIHDNKLEDFDNGN